MMIGVYMIKQYESSDGKKFNTEKECIAHEKSLLTNFEKANKIKLYKEICYEKYMINDCGYGDNDRIKFEEIKMYAIKPVDEKIKFLMAYIKELQSKINNGL